MSEATEQAALFQFLATIEGRIPEVGFAFHVPNGGHRHPAVAAQLKAQGVKRGVPDILLPVRTSGYVGLAIELKAGQNRETKHQRIWLQHLSLNGWCTSTCYGWKAAARRILAYLGHVPGEYDL